MPTPKGVPKPPVVLLVDEDGPFRRALAAGLRERGCRVVCARTAGLVGELAGAEPDLIVAEVRIPGALGASAMPLLQACYPAADMLVVTAHASIASAVQAMRQGAVGYLCKPSSAEMVLAAWRGTWPVTPDRRDIPSLARLEWEHINAVLHATGGNISETARLLRLPRRSLQRKLARQPPEV